MSKPAGGSARKAGGWRPWRFVKGRPRMIVSLLLFVGVAAGLFASGMRISNAILLSFDLAAVVFLGGLAFLFNHAVPAHMRSQAEALDTGRWGVLWGGVALSAVVLIALGGELHAAKGGGLLELAVAVASVVLSWLFLSAM